ncbi:MULTISPECIES: TetR/AcrR family transcriptional regulator [Dactylosporangium]|uniref:TetR family transcriptional regulator n=2 Tax=Dactylosporangium TaxID=35753 RepID=A0A9W6KWC9_9ACTN|nr:MULTISPECIES: helix-turn-helix domain-containing protein [Dactylosporangium]UAB99153.1 helix-turn-helix transcriptional regulator [Dactylosporangium vinaceum]UWZ47397.1 helix-turn-helix transcriptional regulator [Dactylosporangium matsuzakiense]GLL07791.1 TetR family transcriptional regulator [Dactylosporangium matsuzakiense]
MADPAFEDLTARARIRDAAIKLFAEKGAEGTTVREIAQAAGVSPGLLRHHFGSKEGLREVCDEYVLDRAMGIKEEILNDGKLANPGFMPSVHPTVLLTYRYTSRALLDGSPAAAKLFDRMVGIAELWIDKVAPGITQDKRGFATVLIGMQSGLIAMHEHVSRNFGQDMFETEGYTRMVEVLVDFYSTTMLDPALAADAHRAMEALRASQKEQ